MAALVTRQKCIRQYPLSGSDDTGGPRASCSVAGMHPRVLQPSGPGTLDEMTQAEKSPVLLRNLGIWFVVAGFYGFIAALCVGAAANADVPLAGRVVAVAVAGTVAAALAWTYRAGILLQSDRLTVRRYGGRDLHVAWPDVVEAAIVSNGKGGGFVAVFVSDGRVLKTQGLAVNSLDSDWGRAAANSINERRLTTS